MMKARNPAPSSHCWNSCSFGQLVPELYCEKVLPTTDFVTVLLYTERPKPVWGGGGVDREESKAEMPRDE